MKEEVNRTFGMMNRMDGMGKRVGGAKHSGDSFDFFYLTLHSDALSLRGEQQAQEKPGYSLFKKKETNRGWRDF
jgi:hypothetical protein